MWWSVDFSWAGENKTFLVRETRGQGEPYEHDDRATWPPEMDDDESRKVKIQAGDWTVDSFHPNREMEKNKTTRSLCRIHRIYDYLLGKSIKRKGLARWMPTDFWILLATEFHTRPNQLHVINFGPINILMTLWHVDLDNRAGDTCANLYVCAYLIIRIKRTYQPCGVSHILTWLYARIEIQFTVCMWKGSKILLSLPALSATIMKVGLLLRIEPSGFPMGSWILTWFSLNPNVQMMHLKRINSRFPGPSHPVTPP